MDWFLKIFVIIMVLLTVAALVFGIVQIAKEEEAKVEGVVVSCTLEDVQDANPALKAIGTYNFASGTNRALGIVQMNAGSAKKSTYSVIVEYEGTMYTIETNSSYEPGETIRFTIPE